jgi:hypothetical protein
VSGDDALGDEMLTPYRRSDGDPLALDQGTADRLLDGTLNPADAPPAYAAVASVLAAAAAPPRADELTGEAEALDRFAATSQAARSGGRARRRRTARIAVATAAVLGVLSVSGIGLATGVLPQTGAWLGRTVDAVVGPGRAGDAPTPATPPTATVATATVPSSRAPTQGPVPSSTARHATGVATPEERLCIAWQAGQGKKMHAAAFQALAAAAGGADKIPAYCAALPPAKDDPKQPGRPEDPGSGQGQGPGDDHGRRGGGNPAGGPG